MMDLKELYQEIVLDHGKNPRNKKKCKGFNKEAEGYNHLMNEFNYTQEELSSIVSKSRSHVANLLRLTSLPKEIKKYSPKLISPFSR